jgi:SAM-dependent methyltransferase
MKENINMGDVYDAFADQFAKSDALPTWRYVGKPAMESIFKPFFGNGDATFLDMGSASARVERGLLIPNGVKPENITGVEISPDQVKIAQQVVPGANFLVGDITRVELPENAFNVAFSHMVFEHLDDAQLAAASAIAFKALKPGGTFGFVVTHPDKMTDVDGNLITTYGHFQTSAPWGGVLDNWRRSVDDTLKIVREAGFEIERSEEIKFPEVPEGSSEDDRNAYEKYSKYPFIRLLVVGKKPE